jgi:ribosomal protein S8
MTKSLHNLLSIIKNGQLNRILVVQCFNSKFTISILYVLQEHGFIRGYRIISDKSVEILLKYNNQQPIINQCIQISKSSKRVYKSIKNISISSTSRIISLVNPYKDQNTIGFMHGIYILSTSKGILSHYTASKFNVGGEILFYIS